MWVFGQIQQVGYDIDDFVFCCVRGYGFVVGGLQCFGWQFGLNVVQDFGVDGCGQCYIRQCFVGCCDLG